MTEPLLWKWCRIHFFLCNAKKPIRIGKFPNSNSNNKKALNIKCRRKPGIIKDFKKEEREILKSIAM